MSFNNMGKPIPYAKKEAAYQWLREIGIERDEAFGTVGKMSEHLERDHPHEAMEDAQKVVDLTGAYRLMAVLLS